VPTEKVQLFEIHRADDFHDHSGDHDANENECHDKPLILGCGLYVTKAYDGPTVKFTLDPLLTHSTNGDHCEV
jgi:hypothetical protein